MREGGKSDRRRLERRPWGERVVDALRWRAGQRPQWHVALAPGDWTNVSLARDGREILNPPGAYLADPFLCAHAGRLILFVEQYDWAASRGAIAAYALDGDEPAPLGLVLDEPFHLSFPSTFEHEGDLWMAPECSEAGGLRLYRCARFPDCWTLETIHLEGVPLADPLLFARDGRWWLLANRADPGGAFTGRLCAWHAPSPAGPWTEHAANPVVLDRERGRNGGLLWAGNAPHRVGQRQGADVYGRGLGVYRIEALDPETYRECAVAHVGPGRVRGVRAMHHVSCAGGWTAWDMSRWGWPGR